MEKINAKKTLKDALDSRDKQTPPINKKTAQDLDIIIENSENRKAVLAVAVTSLVKKIIDPKQDIRKHQAGMDGGYSGRGFDTEVVTPFLTENNFPYMGAKSGWLTRSLEQNSPYTLDYKGAINPKHLKDAFLRTLDRVQNKKLDPKQALEYIFAGLIAQRDKSTTLRLAKPIGLSIEEIVVSLSTHFMSKYESGGTSRLPVLAIYAAYTQMMKEVSRYKNLKLAPLLRHNAADRKTNNIGDIQIMDADNNVVEAVEVKHLIEIEPSLINAAYNKFKTEPVRRYYLLTTEKKNTYITENSSATTDIQKKCGCQVIVNGIEPTLKYYLRLLENPDTFIISYTELLEKDQDIKYEHREKWNKIVSSSD